MFKIRRVHGASLPHEQRLLAQVRDVLVAQFKYMSEAEATALLDEVTQPKAERPYVPLLFVAEGRGGVRGALVASHFTRQGFLFLDYIASAQISSSRGTGGALYERLREEALLRGAKVLLFECLPDAPELCESPEIHKQNTARLRFYERYGALPLLGTRYETPLSDGSAFHLVVDGLGQERPLRRADLKPMVRAILEVKHADKCSPAHMAAVVDSIKDDVARLREPRGREVAVPVDRNVPADERIALVVNDEHSIHHVRERGYVESPVRIASLLKELAELGFVQRVQPKRFPDSWIDAVHSPRYHRFLKAVCDQMGTSAALYPEVFPVRNQARLPRELKLQVGYYCIDTFTPIDRNAYLAARAGVNCALTAADRLLHGDRIAYALTRPPGHHAERGFFGGFCYLNNAAVAANFLGRQGRVAIVDIDYHHGNGQQDIFYERNDVLTVSIHGDPEFAYPNFSGFADEEGSGEGLGYNLNLPQRAGIEGDEYRRALRRALARVREFQPAFLVVALGLDTAKGDPTGTWKLLADDFSQNGRMFGELRLPTLVVQEGGYKNRVLGRNARHFLQSLWSSAFEVRSGHS